MADVGMIRQLVQARIAELETMLAPLRTEYDQLEQIAATLGGGPPVGSPAPAAETRRPRRPAKAAAKAPGGSRARQALELIADQPGVSATDLAKAIGISRNYLYRVLPKLEQRGVIEKEGTGYRLVPPPPPPPADA